MGNIRLSPKHGVNPSVGTCFFCGADKEVILFGRLPDDAQAPHIACYNKEPCSKCADYMKQGIILISVRKGESGNNPYRTGKWVVVKDAFISRNVIPKELADHILSHRVAFIPDDAWVALGLPTEPTPPQE